MNGVMNLTTKRRDSGMTLVEVLVSIFLLGVVTTIISGVVINALHVTRQTSDGVIKQAALNDAVLRVARDISAADEILFTSTAATPAWSSNSPSGTEVWIQTQRKTNAASDDCVRVRYYTRADASNTDPDDPTDTLYELISETINYRGTSCPALTAPTDPELTPTTSTDTVVTSLRDGAIFDYYNKANEPLSPPFTATTVEDIARVQINAAANVLERDGDVRLITSAAPQTPYTTTPLDTPAVTVLCDENSATPCDDTSLDCPNPITISAYGNTWSGGRRIAPTIGWTPVAAQAAAIQDYTVYRADGAGPPQPVGTTTGNSIQDLTLDAAQAIANPGPYTYSVRVNASGSQADYTNSDLCGSNIYYPYVPAAPSPPSITTTVQPATTTPDAWGATTTSTIRLTWQHVYDTDYYRVYCRQVGTPTWNLVSPANTPVGGPRDPAITTITYDYTNAPFGQNTECRVQGVNPTGASAFSNTPQVLTHPGPVTLTGVVQNYRVNRLTWNAVTSADKYVLYGRDAVTGGAFTEIANFAAARTGANPYDHTVGLSTRWEYKVAAFNTGVRTATPTGPGASAQWASPYSNTVTLLQYPTNPVTSATGTENSNAYNPDGRNTATWAAVPTATQYRVYELDSAATTTAASIANGITGTTYLDTGNPRGSRNFYMAAAMNATGWSPNTLAPADPNYVAAAKAVAYQRPPATPKTAGNVWGDACTEPPAESYTNGNANCDSGLTALRWTNTGDNGDPDKFCAGSNEGACSYSIIRNGGNYGTFYGVPNGEVHVGQSDWGVTDQWDMQPCNLGGCADLNYIPVKTYPGPFGFVRIAMTKQQVINQYQDDGAHLYTPQTWRDWGTSRHDWTAAPGATYYQTQRTPIDRDPHPRSPALWQGGGTTGPTWHATPGARYAFYLTARAYTDLGRNISRNGLMPTSHVNYQQDVHMCNQNAAQGWKQGWRYQRGVFDAGAGLPVDWINDAWYATRMTLGNWNNGNDYGYLSQRWRDVEASSANNNPYPWLNAANWTGGGQEYYRWTTVPGQDWADSGLGLSGDDGSSERKISNLERSGGSWGTRPMVHGNWGGGMWAAEFWGVALIQTEHKGSDWDYRPGACTWGYWGHRSNEAIDKYAYPGRPSDSSPVNSGFWSNY